MNFSGGQARRGESRASAVLGNPLAAGAGQGTLLIAAEGLSFWGGVDPATAEIVDRHHPLSGVTLTDKVLAIPSSRGSCTGSSVLLELILAGKAPAAILVSEHEQVLTIGALVADLAFGKSLPIVRLAREDFAKLTDYSHARIDDGSVMLFGAEPADGWDAKAATTVAWHEGAVALTSGDRAMLEGRHGRAAQFAMRLILKFAALEGATSLIDVTRAHIDGCIYTGPAGLKFAKMLAESGGKVRVPTTLNAISIDRRRWRQHGVPPALGEPAAELADAYEAMGAEESFTCAPYLLDRAPKLGEQIGWAESNAVVYANSVLGARTMKYPDFLDLCIALTGRAPDAGCHRDEGRRASLRIDVERPAAADDSFWPLAGYCAGLVCGAEIPLLCGLEASGATADDLKAFGAAFATSSAAPMFHIAGITPEAHTQAPERREKLPLAALASAWRKLNTGEANAVGLVSLGSPHFSLAECARLAALTKDRRRSPDTAIVVTCGRRVHHQAMEMGYVATAQAFGVRFVNDTCWCMLDEPIVPAGAKTLMTNSGKYAHYAPGLVGRSVRFGGLEACVEAACTGRTSAAPPKWLQAA